MAYRSQSREIKGDDCDYLVDYDYQPEERPNYDINSRNCGPGCAAEVTINSIDIRPHGYSHWMPTDIAKWDMKSNVWDMLVREIEIDMLVSFGGDE